jgi:hypothetical protein
MWTLECATAAGARDDDDDDDDGRGKRRATTVDEGRDREWTRGAGRDARGVREDAERA